MASVIKYKNDINVISVYSSDFFCRCFPLYYLTACVESLLRTQLAEFLPMFGCFFRIVRILAIIAFTRLGFQNRQNLSTFLSVFVFLISSISAAFSALILYVLGILHHLFYYTLFHQFCL